MFQYKIVWSGSYFCKRLAITLEMPKSQRYTLRLLSNRMFAGCRKSVGVFSGDGAGDGDGIVMMLTVVVMVLVMMLVILMLVVIVMVVAVVMVVGFRDAGDS